MRPSLYHEIHVTIEFPQAEYDRIGDALIIDIDGMAKYHGWHLGKLLMVKGGNSHKDMFFTNRSDSFEGAVNLTRWFIGMLQRRGFNVIRYKIEDTVLDSRIDDEWGVLA